MLSGASPLLCSRPTRQCLLLAHWGNICWVGRSLWSGVHRGLMAGWLSLSESLGRETSQRGIISNGGVCLWKSACGPYPNGHREQSRALSDHSLHSKASQEGKGIVWDCAHNKSAFKVRVKDISNDGAMRWGLIKNVIYYSFLSYELSLIVYLWHEKDRKK